MANDQFDWEPVVRDTGRLNFTGNITPHHWYNTILLPSGRPDLIAIILLSEIIYWWRPKSNLNQRNGKLEGYEKKFTDDMLQRSAQGFADKFGLTKRQVQDALKRLEESGLIIREYRNIMTRYGQMITNVLFVAPVVAAISKLDEGIEFIEEEAEEGGVNEDRIPPCATAHRGSSSSAQRSTLEREFNIKNKINKKTNKAEAAIGSADSPPEATSDVAAAVSIFCDEKPNAQPEESNTIASDLTNDQRCYLQHRLKSLKDPEGQPVDQDLFLAGFEAELLADSFQQAGQQFFKKMNTLLSCYRKRSWHPQMALAANDSNSSSTSTEPDQRTQLRLALNEKRSHQTFLQNYIDFLAEHGDLKDELTNYREQLAACQRECRQLSDSLSSFGTSKALAA